MKKAGNGTLIVTGGSRGIGRATASLAGTSGYAVCVNYRRNGEAAESLVESIRDAGGRAVAIAADVGDENDVRRLFNTAEEALGPLRALVNNAAILERQTGFHGLDRARLERVFRVNVTGCFLCAAEAVRRMSTARGGKGGAIVNVSSVAARTGAPHEYIDYAMSKGALDSMTAGLAREVAPEGIRVNSVRPGFIQTDMHADGGEPGRVERLAPGIPMQRGGEPEEVARAILWLLSDDAAYSVGSVLDVAGGI